MDLAKSEIQFFFASPAGKKIEHIIPEPEGVLLPPLFWEGVNLFFQKVLEEKPNAEIKQISLTYSKLCRQCTGSIKVYAKPHLDVKHTFRTGGGFCNCTIGHNTGQPAKLSIGIDFSVALVPYQHFKATGNRHSMMKIVDGAIEFKGYESLPEETYNLNISSPWP
jgi:hypothetical protein